MHKVAIGLGVATLMAVILVLFKAPVIYINTGDDGDEWDDITLTLEDEDDAELHKKYVL